MNIIITNDLKKNTHYRSYNYSDIVVTGMRKTELPTQQ